MAVGNEHKRNLRPYILLFCFFWGLVLGFASYLYMKTAAQRLEIIEVEEEKNKQLEQQMAKKEDEIEQIDPFKKTEDVERPPEVASILTKPEVTLIDDKIISPNFRQPPVIPNPNIEDMPGLSGFTVVLPVKPEQPVVEKPVAGGNNTVQPEKKRRNPFGDESVVLDDIAPPELDD